VIGVFIGVFAAIAGWYGLVWTVRTLGRTMDKAGEILGKEAGKEFVRDAKENPNNPMYNTLFICRRGRMTIPASKEIRIS
jgi:hypothetical protein